MDETLDRSEAIRRLSEDQSLLRETTFRLDADALCRTYEPDGRPLGDFCESLRDLVAHVTMWQEIDLAVVVDALHRRRHWTTGDAWAGGGGGGRLNRSGVAAGRVLEVQEVLTRFDAAAGSLIAVLEELTDEEWRRPVFPGDATTLGRWLQTHLSVPGQPPYCHARLHLQGFQ